MKIQLNTDINIEGSEGLTTHVNTTVTLALKRFSEQITRVEVHLSDENSHKSGQKDQRCMIEARLQGRQPVAVTDHASTLHQAINGATQKLTNLLDSTLGRRNEHREKNTGLPQSDTDAE